MDQLPILNIELNDSELDISWFSGTGPGGQNRNKVMASCRLTHKPTGLTAVSQTRSRVSSFENAKKALLERLCQYHQAKICDIDKSIRKKQVGSGQRGDKIRTIQFQNGTAIDHRTNKRITPEQYMKGEMFKLWPNH